MRWQKKAMKKPALFFTALAFPSFVKKDIATLGNRFDVFVYQFRATPKWLTPVRFLQQLFVLMKRLFSVDGYVCAFGGYHSFLPALLARLTGRPCLIIVAGTDCVSFPSIQYGNLHRKWLGLFTRCSYRLASHISAVHQSLLLYDYTYYPADYPQQGILAFCPGLRTETSVMPYGYDASFFHRVGDSKMPNSFITVAVGAGGLSRYRLKGIDLVVWAARNFPEYAFTIVGSELEGGEALPGNLRTHGVVTAERLRELYSEHEFYLQLSISEGFPNAPCEAMLCECIVIGSRVGALPDIIGDTGFVLNVRDEAMLRHLIQVAVQCDKHRLAQAARQRIIDIFPSEKREQALLALMDRLLNSDRSPGDWAARPSAS